MLTEGDPVAGLWIRIFNPSGDSTGRDWSIRHGIVIDRTLWLNDQRADESMRAMIDDVAPGDQVDRSYLFRLMRELIAIQSGNSSIPIQPSLFIRPDRWLTVSADRGAIGIDDVVRQELWRRLPRLDGFTSSVSPR